MQDVPSVVLHTYVDKTDGTLVSFKAPSKNQGVLLRKIDSQCYGHIEVATSLQHELQKYQKEKIRIEKILSDREAKVIEDQNQTQAIDYAKLELKVPVKKGSVSEKKADVLRKIETLKNAFSLLGKDLKEIEQYSSILNNIIDLQDRLCQELQRQKKTQESLNTINFERLEKDYKIESYDVDFSFISNIEGVSEKNLTINEIKELIQETKNSGYKLYKFKYQQEDFEWACNQIVHKYVKYLIEKNKKEIEQKVLEIANKNKPQEPNESEESQSTVFRNDTPPKNVVVYHSEKSSKTIDDEDGPSFHFHHEEIESDSSQIIDNAPDDVSIALPSSDEEEVNFGIGSDSDSFEDEEIDIPKSVDNVKNLVISKIESDIKILGTKLQETAFIIIVQSVSRKHDTIQKYADDKNSGNSSLLKKRLANYTSKNYNKKTSRDLSGDSRISKKIVNAAVIDSKINFIITNTNNDSHNLKIKCAVADENPFMCAHKIEKNIFVKIRDHKMQIPIDVRKIGELKKYYQTTLNSDND